MNTLQKNKNENIYQYVLAGKLFTLVEYIMCQYLYCFVYIIYSGIEL